jgi:hypothetical protein
MSGLMRGMIDQVLKNMGEDERAQSVNYVTDRMVERMSNEERVALLMAILDRVMSNLSPEERTDLAGLVAGQLSGTTAAPPVVTPEEAQATVGDGESITGSEPAK